uniref:G-protein coupled receptors family 1 profile domain-containing protein n=1 Tax=Plectus sambesii TaxID=2011161 RepID=A0A914XI31_9BILA
MAHSANDSTDILQRLLERKKNLTSGGGGRSTSDALPLDVGYGFAAHSSMLLGSSQQRIIVDKACLKQQLDGAQVARRHTSSTERPNCFKRNADSTMDAQFVFLFMIIAFCAGCLLVAVVCYAVLFRVISRIVKQDMMIFAEITQMQRNATCDGRASVSTDLNSGDPRRVNKQLLRRHKYVIVIGSVIIIYMVYLISYSAIQLLQLGRLTNIRLSQRKTLIVRWTLQILVGLHSIFQPLCYFRMKEFRQIVLRSLGQPCSRRRSSMHAENGFLSASDYPTNHQRISQTVVTAQSTSKERVGDDGGGGSGNGGKKKKKENSMLVCNGKAPFAAAADNRNSNSSSKDPFSSSSDVFHENVRQPLVVRATDTLLGGAEEDEDPCSNEYLQEHMV